jgi:hypothetical protein
MRKDNISLIASLQSLENPLCKSIMDRVLVHSTLAQGCQTQADWVNLRKLKKIFDVLIFHMKKLRNNSYGYIYTKKIISKGFFYSILKIYYLILLSWSIYTKKVFYPTLQKHNFFSCKHRVYILINEFQISHWKNKTFF